MWVKGWWESVVTVSMFILWCVWHGWCAKKFGNTGDKKWNPYLVEIPFRLFNILILYIIFRYNAGGNLCHFGGALAGYLIVGHYKKFKSLIKSKRDK